MIIPPGLDISADLTELGRTPIAVVSAGVKSILDIGRTLEYLVRYEINKYIKSIKYKKDVGLYYIPVIVYFFRRHKVSV